MAKPGEITGIWVDETVDYDHWTWKLFQSAPSGRMESASFAGWKFHIFPGLSDRAFVTSDIGGGNVFMIEGLGADAPRPKTIPVLYDPVLPALTAVRCDRLSRRETRDHG